MSINKLTRGVRIPLEISKGSFRQRQLKSNNLTETLFRNLNDNIENDCSSFTYQQLQKYIDDILPDKNFKLIIQNMAKEDTADYDGLCEVLLNIHNFIRAISINLGGINNAIKSISIPSFIHEFVHAADDMFHPKYLSRLQSLVKKGLLNKKYDDLYDQYYYCTEMIESQKDKKSVLKIIKNKTKKFLRGYNIYDKMDYIQDIRYNLLTEREAYQMQKKVAQILKSKNINILDSDIKDWDKECMIEEKIKLLEKLALEYIKKNRSRNNSRLKRKH